MPGQKPRPRPLPLTPLRHRQRLTPDYHFRISTTELRENVRDFFFSVPFISTSSLNIILQMTVKSHWFVHCSPGELWSGLRPCGRAVRCPSLRISLSFISFGRFLIKEPGEELLLLKQGTSTAADYTLTFRTLAAQTGWDPKPLKFIYRRGLNEELQAELACRDEGKSLEQFMELAIRLDNLIRSRRGRRSTRLPLSLPVHQEQEPMQIGLTHLTQDERDRRLRNHLCLYCGQPGHLRANCPTRPPRYEPPRVSVTPSLETFEINVNLVFDGRDISTTALIDSGAAGNFIDESFAKSCNLPLVACGSRVVVAALDGRPLGSGRVRAITEELELQTTSLHTEKLRLFTIHSPNHPIILGLPWLEKHNPVISWTKKHILQWSPDCQDRCLKRVTRNCHHNQQDKPEEPSTDPLPPPYHDLREDFRTMPTRGCVFPLSQPETESMKQYIEEELAKGFIRPSTSPASAGFFFVKKKDGSLRPCIDYCSLNDITVKYRYPLPLVPSALEQLRSAKYFTKLDLQSAYNLIRIKEGDEWKTAFSTTTGHYEYLVMPFGLSNSPSIFQAFINEVFRDMLHRHVIVYIDDILIFSENLETHINHVRSVLQRLIANKLYAKLPKCEFHQTKISFLGYVISAEGVTMDDQKVPSVVNWPKPHTVKDLQRFLGFANFYRRFIRNFSQIAAPLTSMTRKGPKILHWTPESNQAFQNLKERFTSAPILRHPDPEREFVVEVDASNCGVGAILSQRHGSPPKLFPCAYFSRKLTPAERNYDVGDRELLALKAALEEWRHWLEGAKEPFLVLTDHRNLEPRTNDPQDCYNLSPSPSAPWSHIAIDFITDLPSSNNYITILTVIDRFSKACRVIPLVKLPTAWETAEVMMNQVFRFFGIPDDIVSDRGPQFTSRVWQAFCKHLNINVSLTSGYHPQSNGQVERLNQELTRFLRTYCHQNQQDWSQYVIWAEYAQNSLRKPATGLTPFQCILGYQPPLFPWSGEPTNLPAVDHWLRRSEKTWNKAHVHLRRAVRRTTEQADRHRRPNPVYQPGQWAWLSTRHLRLRLPCKKLSPRYPAGDPEGERDQDEVAANHAPPLIINGEVAYQVHEILDSRRRGRVIQYLIDWEGYGPEERSWINSQDILDPALIEDFHRDHPERPAPRPRGRPRRRNGPRFGSCSQGGSLSRAAPQWLSLTITSGNLRPSSNVPTRTLFTHVPRTDHRF
ncbi:hypothetical protein M9458_002396, partial [Cirrhinus mrigala]